MIFTVAVRDPRCQSSFDGGGNKELGSGVGIKLTTVQPDTEGAWSGTLNVSGCLGAVVGPVVASGVLLNAFVAVTLWLAGLQAASASANSSDR